MNIEETLFKFENKYPFLYEIEVDGFPIYTCFRETLSLVLSGNEQENHTAFIEKKGRIYPRRIMESFVKLIRFRRAKTLIFTSTMFRRDYGRNLSAEYLMSYYPEAVTFEWPSRVEAYDVAYFNDKNKHRYCPLDFYVLIYKIYVIRHKNEALKLENQCRNRLSKAFDTAPKAETNTEKKAIDILMSKMPESYAITVLSHQLLRKFFSKYKNIEYAVDFWGSARENIFPVLPGKFESIELQHGIIHPNHYGYIYPAGANHRCKRFFERTMLVYGESTKQLLVKDSVFREEQIKVIGNPRIIEYRKQFVLPQQVRKLILFTSQPFEQDGAATHYYDTVIPILEKVCQSIGKEDYYMAIKLHPRENNGVREIYEEKIPTCKVYDNSAQLFELLGQSRLHITVSSTTLYEAALFDCPTVCIDYDNRKPVDNYGFETWNIKTSAEVEKVLQRCLDKKQYKDYLAYLKRETMQYM